MASYGKKWAPAQVVTRYCSEQKIIQIKIKLNYLRDDGTVS